jgi:hypothetical protein
MINNNLNKVGPCGTCCEQCLAAKNDPKTIDMLVAKGFPREALPCKGCRAINGHCPSPSLGGKQCGIFACAESQNFKFCFECTKSPCDRLMPLSNAGVYRYHNMKCFNLLYIQKHGVDDFCENAERIQQMYFNNKLEVVGEKPQ